MFVNLFLMRCIKYNAFDIKNISRYNNGNENGGLAMNEMEYQMIFKRKSFHLFKDTGHLSDMELVQIEDAFRSCRTLVPEIKVDMMIVPADQTSCKRGQEYCMCDHRDTIFVATRKIQRYCCDKCRRKGE